jgi:acyl carrier protein
METSESREFLRLRSIVAECAGLNPSDVSLDSRFIEDLEIDSLEFVEMIQQVNSTYDLNLTGKDVLDLCTVRQLLSVVETFSPSHIS